MKIFLVALAMIGLPQYASANAKVVGNGGDEYSVEFTQLAHELTDWLAANRKLLPKSFSMQAYRTALKTTQVESTDEPLSLNGATKDALNFPAQKRILFNRAAWNRILSLPRKKALVFHEYLGILGIDDSRYQISRLVIKSEGLDDSSHFGIKEWSCEGLSSRAQPVEIRLIHAVGLDLRTVTLFGTDALSGDPAWAVVTLHSNGDVEQGQAVFFGKFYFPDDGKVYDHKELLPLRFDHSSSSEPYPATFSATLFETAVECHRTK